MSARIERLKGNLVDGRKRLYEVFDQVGDRWETQVYSDGAAWTVRQLGIHLVITDKGHNNMLMSIAKGENTIPEDFDLERFNKRSVEKRAEMTVPEIREALDKGAAERLAWLDSIEESALDKQGRHGSMHILSISQILKVIAHHDSDHANDVAKVLNIE